VRLVEYVKLTDAGGFGTTTEFKAIEADVMTAITHVRWPPGTEDFTIRPVKNGNGVRVIKNGFAAFLESRGWELEHRDEPEEAGPRPGAFDAWRSLDDTSRPPFVAEWETGNISSSHRALNKMALGLVQERLSGGVLVLPTRDLYRFLTDRVGNYLELSPYFPMWRALPVAYGLLAVIAVEHDHTSMEVPAIPKGTNGRALG
jgi:hypothetical protein